MHYEDSLLALHTRLCKVGLAVTQACSTQLVLICDFFGIHMRDYIFYTICAMHIAEIGLLTVLLTARRHRIAPIPNAH